MGEPSEENDRRGSARTGRRAIARDAAVRAGAPAGLDRYDRDLIIPADGGKDGPDTRVSEGRVEVSGAILRARVAGRVALRYRRKWAILTFDKPEIPSRPGMFANMRRPATSINPATARSKLPLKEFAEYRSESFG